MSGRASARSSSACAPTSATSSRTHSSEGRAIHARVSVSGKRGYLLVAVATAAVFARALPYPLQLRWDDGRFVVDNAFVRTPSWAAWQAIWSGPQLEAYHPLHLLSYWLDVPWSDAAPLVVHVVSLLLWLGAAALT